MPGVRSLAGGGVTIVSHRRTGEKGENPAGFSPFFVPTAWVRRERKGEPLSPSPMIRAADPQEALRPRPGKSIIRWELRGWYRTKARASPVEGPGSGASSRIGRS
jgi:hypothetical protein